MLRLVALLGLTYSDITFSVPNSLLWSLLEPCIGCMCACVPLMRPLFNAIFPDRMSKDRKTYGYIPERRDTLTRSDDQSSNGNASRTPASTNEIKIHGGRVGETKEDILLQDRDVEHGDRDGINVKKEVHVQHF